MFSHHSESTLKTFGLFQTYYPPLTLVAPMASRHGRTLPELGLRLSLRRLCAVPMAPSPANPPDIT